MNHRNAQWAGRAVLTVFLLLAIVFLISSCGRIPDSRPMPEPSGDTYEEEERDSGMIEVDVGDGETRWIRRYDDVPASPFTADQFDFGDRYVRYTGEDYTAMQGIDVSTFQGEIDWPAVAADGIEFAMIRIGGRGYSEGNIYADDRFAENLRGAADAGILAGVYFFSQAVSPEEAEEEADFILGILADLPEGSVTMPVAFDWEMVHEEESRTQYMDGETLTACAAAFCGRIAAAGHTPIVYAYRYLAYEMYDLSVLSPYPLWISTLDHSPDFYYSFDMWQYTENGSVDGILTPVDLNLWFVPAEPDAAPKAEAETMPDEETETAPEEELPALPEDEEEDPAEGS